MMTSSTNGNEASATPQGNRSSLQQRQRRTFAVGSLRFQCSRQRLLDAVIDCVSSSVEGFVYLIGPVLIILALLIMSLLTYTFFAIIMPMMDKKYELHPLKTLILALHSGFVVVLLVNILFNYAACVLHRHTGPQYDKVVRELAAATPDFDYPETPEELAIYKRDFSDRMVLRLRRRRARAEEAAAAANCTSSSDHSSTAAAAVPEGMVKRRAAPNAATPSASPRGKQQQATPPVVRGWMLLGPYEWSYCSNTNQPKPPRSHYDNVTGCLVLNLDHYCPWMFNAIGYFNYRYFVNFLIQIFIGMTYGTAVMLEPFLFAKSPEYRSQVALQRRAIKEGLTAERMQPMVPFREEKMLLTLSFMLCAAVGIAILILGGFHVYLTCTAQTTIEFHGNWAARKRARAAGQKWKNPYSQGSCMANWQQVYGTGNLLFSLLPSLREPEFMPVPMPGHTGRRMGKPTNVDKGGDESVIPCDAPTGLSGGLKAASLV